MATGKNERYNEQKLLTQLKLKVGINDGGIFVYTQELPEIFKGKVKSKTQNGTGDGKPEFVIANEHHKNQILFVECKAKITDHKKAIDEVKHYMHEAWIASNNVTIYGIASSGPDKIKTTFFKLDNDKEYFTELTDKNISYQKFIDVFVAPESINIIENNELAKLLISMNKRFHKIGFPAKDRSTALAAILSALQMKEFDGYKNFNSVSVMSTAVTDCSKKFLKSQNLENSRILSITNTFGSVLKKHKTLEIDELITIISELDDAKLIIDKYKTHNRGVDMLGKFFNAFLRYGTTDSKSLGQVLTPDHIADLFTELVNDGKGFRRGDRMIDITCGTGSFMVQSLIKMFKNARNEDEYNEIRKNGVWGNERDEDLVLLTILNNILHGDGKSNVSTGDALPPTNGSNDIFKEWIVNKKANLTHALINPPYYKKDSIPPELVFARRAASLIKPGGEVIMIAPTSVLIGSNHKEQRAEMMNENTLKATFVMPKDLFTPFANVETSISIWEAQRPHQKTDKVFTALWRDDGFKVMRGRGRQDKHNLWKGILKYWVNMYRNKEVIPGISAIAELDDKDEWTVFPYVETDYASLKFDNFVETVKKYASFIVMEGKNE